MTTNSQNPQTPILDRTDCEIISAICDTEKTNVSSLLSPVISCFHQYNRTQPIFNLSELLKLFIHETSEVCEKITNQIEAKNIIGKMQSTEQLQEATDKILDSFQGSHGYESSLRRNLKSFLIFIQARDFVSQLTFKTINSETPDLIKQVLDVPVITRQTKAWLENNPNLQGHIAQDKEGNTFFLAFTDNNNVPFYIERLIPENPEASKEETLRRTLMEIFMTAQFYKENQISISQRREFSIPLIMGVSVYCCNDSETDISSVELVDIIRVQKALKNRQIIPSILNTYSGKNLFLIAQPIIPRSAKPDFVSLTVTLNPKARIIDFSQEYSDNCSIRYQKNDLYYRTNDRQNNWQSPRRLLKQGLQLVGEKPDIFLLNPLKKPAWEVASRNQQKILNWLETAFYQQHTPSAQRSYSYGTR